MRRSVTLCAAMALMLAFSPQSAVRAADEDDGIDSDGFISTWVVVAPIPLDEGQSGDEALGKAQVKDEANLRPKVGDMVEAGGKTLTWKAARTKGRRLDFNDQIGQVTENSVAYAVAYLVSDAKQAGLTMKVGSDDQVKIYLNGKQVHSKDGARALEEDSDLIPDIALDKGANVLVLKLVNEGVDWEACVRFVDKDGNPVKGLKATLPGRN